MTAVSFPYSNKAVSLESAAKARATPTTSDFFAAFDSSKSVKGSDLNALGAELVSLLEPQLQDLFNKVFSRNPRLMEVTDSDVTSDKFNIVCVDKTKVGVVADTKRSVKSTLAVSSAYKELRKRTTHEIKAVKTPKGISLSW